MPTCLLLLSSWLMACGDPWPGAPSSRAPAPQPLPPAPALSLPPADLPAPPPPPSALRAADGDLRARLRSMRDGEVPQVDGAFELFEDAPETTREELDGGVLLCDVRVSPSSGADSYKGPDLTLLVRAGSMRGHLRGAEDTWAWTLSMPITSLRDADAIWTRVVDRDTWDDETIGERSVPLRTLPVKMRTRFTRVECRGQPRARLTGHIARATRALDADVERVTRRRPDPTLARFGYPFAEVDSALGRTSRLAAWVGWHDRLVEERAGRLIVWDLSFREQSRALVAQLATSLPPPGQAVAIAPGLEARVGERTATNIRLDVTRAGPDADPTRLLFELIDQNAAPHRATLTSTTPTSWTLLAPTRSSLLRISTSRGPAVWLRLE